MRLILSMHKSAAKECAPLGTTSTEKSPTLAQLAIQYHQSQAPSGRRAKKKKSNFKKVAKEAGSSGVPAERSPPGEIDLRRRLLAEPWGSLLKKEE